MSSFGERLERVLIGVDWRDPHEVARIGEATSDERVHEVPKRSLLHAAVADRVRPSVTARREARVAAFEMRSNVVPQNQPCPGGRAPVHTVRRIEQGRKQGAERRGLRVAGQRGKPGLLAIACRPPVVPATGLPCPRSPDQDSGPEG